MTACRNWVAGAAAAEAGQPLRSTVPALLMSGEVDPVTPPKNGDEVARTLPNARHIVIPGHGHTLSIGQPCIGTVLKQFIQTANATDLDISCLSRVRR
jgi:pimeloyl-ACP methyl ester carboxylesterase